MPGKPLSDILRAQIVVLHKEGFGYRKISDKLGVPLGTISRAVNLYRKFGVYKFPKRTGRKRCSDARTDHAILVKGRRYPFLSSKALRAQLPDSVFGGISARTIRRRLVEKNLRPFRPARKPMLSAKNIRDRIKFCEKYKDFTAEQWMSTMFCDESTFSQHSTFLRHVRRPPQRRYSSSYILSAVKTAPKVMVWGTISGHGRCGLWLILPGTTIKGKVYLDILKEKVPAFMQIRSCDKIVHDGAPCHRTKSVKEWFERHNIDLIGPWPGNSPDLNPIENCWRLVKERVAARNPTSSASLIDAIKHVWVSEVSEDLLKRLVESMPTRIQACLQAKGRHTKY